MSYKNKEQQGKDSNKKRKIIQELKSVPCVDCGKTFPPECMDFDHKGYKSFNISRVGSHGLISILKEIEKCDIVCSNCHRIRTNKRIKNK